MIRTLLIANRGEIACRIIRTARRMGIATVAVHSDADATAQHVLQADKAIRIGPPAPRDSYLNIPALLAAAEASGADAIHPGYGFLAENAGFAQSVADAGRVFVGPPPSAIRAMGGKSEAKALMDQAGVPLVPGYHGTDQTDATLAAEAERIGYPVLIKASAGGGGKGMRIVTAPADLPDAIASARREALAAFADDRLLLERYLQRPRHIEIQVFADSHGNIVHLFERDCSIQRRHQKIVEEAPAPGMTEDMRAAMGAAAVAAARAVNYVGAGTVEFIVEDGRFHFMEMNTRLQVEHPVTEAITGLDLVEWQLRVAAGEPLPLRQSDLAIAGHAIEVRLCAEDPARDFLPATGTLAQLHFPDGIRIDTGVTQGDSITPDYDPMIAKLIAHGPTRAAALGRLHAALSRSAIAGVRTNLALLTAIAGDAEFAEGGVDTGFLGRRPDLLAPPPLPDAALAAAALTVRGRARETADPWSATDAFRLNLPGSVIVHLRHGETTHTVTNPTGSLTQTGLRLGAETIPLSIHDAGATITVTIAGTAHEFAVIAPLAPPSASVAGAEHVLAPIPGRITAVLCAPGDAVTRGQKLIVMEAMKMETTLIAAMDGVIAAVRCAVGDMVQEGADLVGIEDK